jgi:hypothetical protein
MREIEKMLHNEAISKAQLDLAIKTMLKHGSHNQQAHAGARGAGGGAAGAGGGGAAGGGDAAAKKMNNKLNDAVSSSGNRADIRSHASEIKSAHEKGDMDGLRAKRNEMRDMHYAYVGPGAPASARALAPAYNTLRQAADAGLQSLKANG